METTPTSAVPRTGPQLSSAARRLEIGDTTLLVNPCNGNWLRLSPRGARAVRRLEEAAVAGRGPSVQWCGEVTADADSLLPILARGGFLAGAGPDAATQFPERRDLQNVLLNLTHRCNLRCSHCAVYAAGSSRRLGSHLAAVSGRPRQEGTSAPLRLQEASTAELLSLIDRLAERGARRLVFFGGEPLVRRDFHTLLAHAAERIASLGLTTNGTLLSPAVCRLLRRYRVEVRVSLDGSCAEVNDRVRGPGSFARTLSGLANLKAAGCERLVLKTVVLRLNLDDVPRLVKLSRRLGAGLELSPFVVLGRGASDPGGLLPSPKELVRMYQRVWFLAEYFEVPSVSFNAFCHRFMARSGESCGAGCDYVLVDWTGDVFPCEGLQHRSFRMGNLGEDETFRPPPAELFSVEGSQRCQACPVRYFCRGACAAERIVPGGLGTASSCGFYRLVLPRIASVFEPRKSSWRNLQAAFPGEIGPELLRPYLEGDPP